MYRDITGPLSIANSKSCPVILQVTALRGAPRDSATLTDLLRHPWTRRWWNRPLKYVNLLKVTHGYRRHSKNASNMGYASKMHTTCKMNMTANMYNLCQRIIKYQPVSALAGSGHIQCAVRVYKQARSDPIIKLKSDI